MVFGRSMDLRVAKNAAYDGGVGRGCGTGRGLGVGTGLGVAVTVGLGVEVGVAVGLGVGVGPDCAQYLPPVLRILTSSAPPHTIILLPVHTAV